MIVLHVHSGNLYGGIETVVATLARETDRAAVDHHVALAFDGRFADTLRGLGANVHALGEVRLTDPASVRAARKALRRCVAELCPVALVTHLPWTHAVFGAGLKRAGRPLVQWVHGPLTGVLGSIARFTRPDAIICNSAHTQSMLPAAYRSIPATVLLSPVSAPPAFDAASRARMRASLDTGPDDVVIVQASRFERWKGHREHFEALGRLADLPGWVLWVAGGAQRADEAAYLDELRKLAVALRIARRIRFAGEQSSVAPLLAAADLYCQPNIEPEPFGIVYVEALWAGLPVIASDRGACPEIVNASTGVLVEPGNVAGLANALQSLITDRTRRAQLGRSAPERARTLCDPARQALQISGYLESVVARHAA
jgi:glycosyltransferase involved in cell wall biosynthesis